MLIISIFIANQFRVLFILIWLIVQVVDPESTRVQDNYCDVYGTESITTDVERRVFKLPLEASMESITKLAAT